MQPEPSITHVNIHFDPEEEEERECQDNECQDNKNECQDKEDNHNTKEYPQLIGCTNMHIMKPQPRFTVRQELLNQNAKFFASMRKFFEKHHSNLHITFTVFLFFFDIYKIVMGSFLTLFTYQNCDLMIQKLSCFGQPYQVFALAWNCLTFIMCFVLLGFQIRREAFFLRELMMDTHFYYKTIEDTMEQFFSTYKNSKQIIEQVVYFNEKYILCVKLCTFCFLCNTIFSAVSIYTYSYVSNKTATSFASNVLLLGLLVAKAVYVGYKTLSSRSVVAYSAYKQEIDMYNSINITKLYLEEQKEKNKREENNI